MGVILGDMYVELNELTAYDSYLSSNFHWLNHSANRQLLSTSCTTKI